MSARFAAKVRRLEAEFIATLPSRARALERLTTEIGADGADRERMSRLRTEVHQLKGAAGMYRLDAVYAAARDAETELDRALESLGTGRVVSLDPSASVAPLLEALFQLQKGGPSP